MLYPMIEALQQTSHFKYKQAINSINLNPYSNSTIHRKPWTTTKHGDKPVQINHELAVTVDEWVDQ